MGIGIGYMPADTEGTAGVGGGSETVPITKKLNIFDNMIQCLNRYNKMKERIPVVKQ